MPAGWRTVRVFISSTFRDMQAERDHFVRFVFPRLRAELLKRRVHLVDVDLRWGVTSEQDALSVCREIIDECRPRFLCMLGGRYGWTPPGEERSITADEVYYAALDETEPGGYEFFYFREPAATKSIPEDAAREGGYREFPSDEEVAQFGPEPAQERAGERTRKLETLKQAVRDAGLPVFEYPCRWDDDKQRLVDLQAFGDAVYRDLMASIDHELGADPPPALDWFSEENAAMESFIEERTERYVVGSRQALLDEMTAHAEGSDGPGVMVVTGEPGSGKSALLGRFHRDYAASHPDEIVIPHFIGASRGSTSIRQTLRRLCHDIAQAAGIDDDIPEDVRELAALLPQLLERTAGRELTDDDGGGLEARPTRHVGRGEPAEDGGGLEARPAPEEDSVTRPVVIIIDALNQLDATDNAHALTWLPVALPEGVRIICSSLEHQALDALRRRGEHVQEVVCGPLTPDDAGAIVDEVLARYRKRFDDAQRSVLLAKPDAGVPLYLLAALEELRTLGTYELIAARIEELPGTVTELFDWILQRLEQGIEGQEAFGGPLVSTYTASIAVGRGGMTEGELEALCAPVDEEHEFWVLHRMLRPYLMSRGELVDYFHGQLREAVERCYLYDDEARRHRHGLIAEHLQGRGYEYVRMLSELPYHLTAAEAWDTLEDTLTDLTFLETKTEAGMVFELAGDFTAAVDAIPRERPVWKHLRLLNQALRNDLHFISRHPSTLFQCFWNSAWWYDCDEAAEHYDPPDGGWDPNGAPWERPEPRLCTVLERWRREKEARQPGFYWVRSLRPPPQALGGAQVACLRGHADSVLSVAFSPDGRRLASGADDGTVRVWDSESGAEVVCLSGHELAATSVAFSPDGRWLASGCRGLDSAENVVRVLDSQSGAEVACLRGHEDSVSSVAFSPDGQRLASGSHDQTVRVWDIGAGTEIGCLRGQDGWVTGVAFSPDGRRIASAHGGRTVRVWDSDSRAEIACLRGHDAAVNCVAFSPDGLWVASGAGESLEDDNTVRVWDSRNGVEVDCLRGHDGIVRAVVFSPDGRRIASGGGDATVRVWDTGNGAQVACLRGHQASVNGLAFSPDGWWIASAAGEFLKGDNSVRVWDSEIKDDVACLRGHDGDVRSVALSPDGRWIASGGHDATMWVWDSESGLPVCCLHGHEKSIASLVFSSDGRRLASGAEDGMVRAWESNGGSEVARMCGHRDRVTSVAFSPDRRRIASGSLDRTVRVWDSESGAEVACLRGHEGYVWSVAFSPDGRWLASGSDTAVRVWESNSGEEVGRLHGHAGPYWILAFSPDGRRVSSPSRDGALLWDDQSDEWVEVTQEPESVTATTTGLPSCPRRAIRREFETAIEDPHSGAEIAWFAIALEYLSADPLSHRWAGATNTYVALIALEAGLSGSPLQTPGDPYSRVATHQTVPTGSRRRPWWRFW